MFFFFLIVSLILAVICWTQGEMILTFVFSGNLTYELILLD